jgi:hypothetical protein
MSKDCLRTRAIHALCDVCRNPAAPMHTPIRGYGFFCEGCCPHCSTAKRSVIRPDKPISLKINNTY